MKKTVLLTVGCVLLAPTVPAHAAEGAEACDGGTTTASPVQACGTTVITGRDTGRIRIRIPQPLELMPTFTGSDPDIVIDGSGPFVGLALTADVPGRDGYTLLAGRVPKKWGPEDDPSPVGPSRNRYLMQEFPGGFVEDGESAIIPAGDYLLYLLANGTPARIEVRLRQLDGAVTISPTSEVPFRSQFLSPRLKVDDHAEEATAVGELETSGIVLGWLWMHDSPEYSPGAVDGRLCRWRGDIPATARLDRCDGSEGGGGFTGLGLGGAGGEVIFSGRESAGKFSFKSWMGPQVGIEDKGAVAFWLSFD